MRAQLPLFSAANMAGSVAIPPAPSLIPHSHWPYPGMTPEDSARASMSRTDAYYEMLAAVLKSKGGARLTTKQVLSLVPHDWRELCGNYAHGNISNWTAKEHQIEITYVSHEGVGGHFEYMAQGCSA